MKSNAKTVEQYLAELPEDRREQISKVRDVILKNLPDGYEEMMDFGMIAYVVPLERYPETYNKHALMYAALASQKNHMAVYAMNCYAQSENEKWFIKEYKKTGKKLDMGRSCIRFKKLEDLPLDLIGELISKTSVEEYIKIYEDSRK